VMLGCWVGNARAWRKVVAAYRRVYGFGHLRADCGGPGSAPEPYARFAYGPIFTFYDSTTSVGFVFTVTFCQHRNKDR